MRYLIIICMICLCAVSAKSLDEKIELPSRLESPQREMIPKSENPNYSNKNRRGILSPPINVTVVNEGFRSMGLQFDDSPSETSGNFKYYSYAVGGINPNSANYPAEIYWWTICMPDQNNIVGFSLDELNSYCQAANLPELKVGDKIYFSIKSCATNFLDNSEAVTVECVISDPVLGEANNALTYGFTNKMSNFVWSSTEIGKISRFLNRMLPIIKEVYGPPSHSFKVNLNKDQTRTGTNVFYSDYNTIDMADFSPQLLTHELIHAMRDFANASTDENWHCSADGRLLAFEEGFTQGVSYECMNIYGQRYPSDEIFEGKVPPIYDSRYEWYYDLNNTDILTTKDYWSGGSGDPTQIAWRRYELGATAIRKIMRDIPLFPKYFNAEYYKRLNNDKALLPSRELMLDIVKTVAEQYGKGTIEGKPATTWINQQRMFDCKVNTGFKIYIKQSPYPSWQWFDFNTISYYETFANGSEWGILSDDIWRMFRYNGASGTASVKDWNNNIIAKRLIQTSPLKQPDEAKTPKSEGYTIGRVELGFGNSSYSSYYDLMKNPENSYFQLTNTGVYRLKIEMKHPKGDAASTTQYVVMGEGLNNLKGVYGIIVDDANGVDNAIFKSGKVWFSHNGGAETGPYAVTNGLFKATTNWTGIKDANGNVNSTPGQVKIRFVDNNGNTFTDMRNIGWGSQWGNQFFILKTQNMIGQNNGQTSINENSEVELFGNYPNPFNPTTRISFSLKNRDLVSLQIYNSKGEVVKTLLNEIKEAGNHTLSFDASDMSGGLYYCKIKNSGHTKTLKMLYLK